MRLTCCRQDNTYHRILNPFYSKGAMPLREAREKTKFVRSNDKQNNHGGSDTWGDIMNTGSIHEYNEFLGVETLNPVGGSH